MHSLRRIRYIFSGYFVFYLKYCASRSYIELFRSGFTLQFRWKNWFSMEWLGWSVQVKLWENFQSEFGTFDRLWHLWQFRQPWPQWLTSPYQTEYASNWRKWRGTSDRNVPLVAVPVFHVSLQPYFRCYVPQMSGGRLVGLPQCKPSRGASYTLGISCIDARKRKEEKREKGKKEYGTREKWKTIESSDKHSKTEPCPWPLTLKLANGLASVSGGCSEPVPHGYYFCLRCCWTELRVNNILWSPEVGLDRVLSHHPDLLLQSGNGGCVVQKWTWSRRGGVGNVFLVDIGASRVVPVELEPVLLTYRVPEVSHYILTLEQTSKHLNYLWIKNYREHCTAPDLSNECQRLQSSKESCRLNSAEYVPYHTVPYHSKVIYVLQVNNGTYST